MKRAIAEMLIIVLVAVGVGAGLLAYTRQQDEKYAAQSLVVATHSAISRREGCERVNLGIRRPLYQLLVSAEAARRESAGLKTGEARLIDLRAAREFSAGIRQMIANAKPAEPPGSPYVDCDLAYPLP